MHTYWFDFYLIYILNYADKLRHHIEQIYKKDTSESNSNSICLLQHKQDIDTIHHTKATCLEVNTK